MRVWFGSKTRDKGSGKMVSTPSNERLVEHAAFWDSALLLVTFLNICKPAKETGKKVQGHTALKIGRQAHTLAGVRQEKGRKIGCPSLFSSQGAR